jgi:hypothetical protein
MGGGQNRRVAIADAMLFRQAHGFSRQSHGFLDHGPRAQKPDDLPRGFLGNGQRRFAPGVIEELPQDLNGYAEICLRQQTQRGLFLGAFFSGVGRRVKHDISIEKNVRLHRFWCGKA